MKVITLSEFSEERFINLLKYLSANCKDKNKDWFPVLLNNYKKYMEWFFVVDELNNFIAFSTIQQFYEKCYRVLTRTYVVDEYRRSNLIAYRKPVTSLDNHHLSPPSYMIQAQLKYLNNYDSIFITFEGMHRSKIITNMSRKLEVNTGLKWVVGKEMFLTCPNPESSKCWQNLCYSGKEPHLDKISKEEWINRYGK